MRRDELVMCQTFGVPLTVKHLIVYGRNHKGTRESLGIPDSLFEALNPNQDNTFLNLLDV